MADRITLQLENAQLNLAPDESAVVRLNLTNSGDVVDAFTITVVGLDPAWYTLSIAEVKLFPRGIAAVTLQISPPKTGTRPLAGFYPFTVMALSRDNPTEQAVGQGMVNLSAAGGTALDLQPRRIAGRQGLYAVTLSNSSNAPRTTVLSLSDPEEALQFSIGTPMDISALSNTAYTEGIYVTPPAYGTTTAKGKGILEHEIELPPGSSVVIPVMVKPAKRVWTGKERPFPFSVGAHPPGVEWEASEAQMVEGQLAYRPIFAAWAGTPLTARRALLILIPLLILACLLFLLLRPQDKPSVSAASQTATAQALSVGQTQTAQAASLSQTMTAVAKANGGDTAAANATLTAMALERSDAASGAQTAQAAANASATAQAGGAGGAGGANIDRFYLRLGNPNVTATPVGGGIAGSETSLQYDVTDAMAVRISQSSQPFQSEGLQNASVIDFRMVATGTNQLPVTRTLSVLVVRPPLITSFEGAPLTVESGDNTNLLWTTLGAKDVTIDGNPVSTTGADGAGQISVQPTGSRRFIMCASNAVGSVCRSVLVTVLQPSAPTSTPAPPTAVPTSVPPTTVPTVTATVCTLDYVVAEEASAKIVPGNAQVPGLQCDDCASTVLLPFPFQLYDRVFDRVSVGSNGTLNFASNATPPSTNACLPITSGFDFAIFAHWDNLTTVGANRGVFTRVDGEAPNRIFTIEWRAAYVTANAPTGTGNANFEVRLFEDAPDQRFEVIYGTLTGGGTNATVGVQRDTGSYRTQYACNTSNKVETGLKLIFTLPCGGSGTGERPPSCLPGNKTVNIVDGNFSPRNIIITQGSTVSWFNLDSTLHNTVGLNTEWVSNALTKNQEFKFVFNTPGVYYYTSTLDKNLSGNITVLPGCLPTPTPTRTSTHTPTSTRTVARTATRVATNTTIVRTATRAAITTPTLVATATLTRTATRVVTSTSTAGTPTSTATLLPTVCPIVERINGSIKSGDRTQVGRIRLYDAPSTCTTGNTCLPPSDSMPRRYDAYTLANNTNVGQCITIQIDARACRGTGLTSVAYLGSFDPNNVCLNFLAQGGPPSAQYRYSFMVPAGATYVVVVHESGPNEDCDNYTVSVGICLQPTPTPEPDTPTPRPRPSKTPSPTAIPTDTRQPSPVPTTPVPTATRCITGQTCPTPTPCPQPPCGP